MTRKGKCICLVVVALTCSGCASGSAIVTGKVRPATAPESVKLYTQAPAEYEVIGIVKASSDAGWTQQGDQNYTIRELKKQAAKLGANGVIVRATGEEMTGLVYGLAVTAQTIQGEAVFVIRE